MRCSCALGPLPKGPSFPSARALRMRRDDDDLRKAEDAGAHLPPCAPPSFERAWLGGGECGAEEGAGVGGGLLG